MQTPMTIDKLTETKLAYSSAYVEKFRRVEVFLPLFVFVCAPSFPFLPFCRFFSSAGHTQFPHRKGRIRKGKLS